MNFCSEKYLFCSLVASWMKHRNRPDEIPELTMLFDRYMPPLLDANKKFNRITSISDISMIQMTCHLLDCLLTRENVPANCPREWYELYFVFAAIWGFGSTLSQDQQTDWRMEFSKFWINEFQAIPFDDNANVFDYYVDVKSKAFKLWDELVPQHELDPDIPLQVRALYILSILTI